MSPICDVNVIQFISVRQSRRPLTQQTHKLHFWSTECSCFLGSFSVLYCHQCWSQWRAKSASGRGCLKQYITFFLADRVEGLGEELMMLPGCRSWWQELHTAATDYVKSVRGIKWHSERPQTLFVCQIRRLGTSTVNRKVSKALFLRGTYN